MGAWDVIYGRGDRGDPGTALAYGILALKRELKYNGYGANMTMATPVFGDAMDVQTRAFQRDHRLVTDGQIGPLTAHMLYEKRFESLQVANGILAPIVCQGCRLESGFDPGAVGTVDPNDHGIMQINSQSHPEIPIEKAFDAAYSLSFYARSLRSAYERFDDWDCAIASWNVGSGGAQEWCRAGKPANDLPTSGDLFTRANRYVKLVRTEPC